MTPRNRFESLFENLSSADTVAPSKVGGQFYCERKVDLEREHGEIETPEKTRGSETHEKAAEDAVEVDMDEVWDAIERGDRQILVESPFVGEVDDHVIVGIPDAIVFNDRKPQLIFDRKTTSIPDRLFNNQRIQVWLYGYMLEDLGFETEDLRVAILSHEQRVEPDTGKRLQKMVLSTIDEFDEGQTQLRSDPDVYLHTFPYSPSDHLSDLEWALEYWRDNRDPVPTENPAKCRSCPHASMCPDSLA